MASHEGHALDDEDPLPVILTGDDDDEAPFEDIRFSYESKPEPGTDLWDTEDMTRLELAKCRAYVRVVELDPKMGTYRLRMKCLWFFRTLNSGEEAEIGLRGVPGVRMPGLVTTVEESRIWKDLNFDGSSRSTTGKTLCWRGITLLTLDGCKALNVIDFPFDRHILNLERIEFVWRADKDEADYHKSMRLVSFEVHTSSLLPEWRAFPAYIRQLNETQRDTLDPSAPTYASSFTVHLRLQRKHRFYSWQVFLVSYLITMLSIMPMGLPPGMAYVGDRFALYSGGMLTLVAFKYGVSDRLPCVPYQTFTDHFLLAQILTIFGCAVATLYPFRAAGDDEFKLMVLDVTENTVAGCIALLWSAALLYAVFWKPWRRVSWRDVLIQDLSQRDPFRKEQMGVEVASRRRNRRTGMSGLSHMNNLLSNVDSQGSLLHSGSRLNRCATKLRSDFSPRTPRSPEAVPHGCAHDWTVEQVALFISSLGLDHCLHLFKDNAVDGKMLVELDKKDLQEDLGLRPLQARKVMSHLKRYSAPAPKT